MSKWLQSPEDAVRLVLAYINPPSEFLVRSDERYYDRTTNASMTCCLKPKDGRLLMEFSLRYWNITSVVRDKPDQSESGGLVICRSVSPTYHGKLTQFVEARSILAVNSCGSYNSPVCVTIILADKFSEFHEVEEVADDVFCRRYGFRCGAQPDAITLFLARMIAMLETSQEAWFEVVDAMNDTHFMKAYSIFNFWHPDNHSIELMFDRSFKQSKDCFAMLQFLKVAMDYVLESKNSFNSFRRIVRDLSPMDPHMGENVLKNLDTASKLVDDVTEKTLQRLQQQVDATTRLRDGIFSATSLKEAHEAMKLNSAIYVFTIVTVLYAPLGFLATFWALPFLNDGAENTKVPESTAFLVSVILIPLLTYTTCLPPVSRGLNRLWKWFWNSPLLRVLAILLLLLASGISRFLAAILGSLFSTLIDFDDMEGFELEVLMNDDFVEPERCKVESKLLWRLFRPIRWFRWVRGKMKRSLAEGPTNV